MRPVDHLSVVLHTSDSSSECGKERCFIIFIPLKFIIFSFEVYKWKQWIILTVSKINVAKKYFMKSRTLKIEL